jgi:peptidyl-prolyl cis-trans isomerase A (cyclophilin A)
MNIRRTLLFSSLAVAVVAAVGFIVYAKQATSSGGAPASQDVPDAPQATPEATTVPKGPSVVMDTSMGRITCQFYEKQAPKAVANFIALAEGTKDWTDPTTKKMQHHKPYYDGTIFHRVIPEFMIQGGDPTGTGMGDPGFVFDDEFDPGLNFDRPGRLAMANSGPNTNGSQFFITEQATDFLDQHYTLFGQCDDASVAVVKAIARVPRDSSDRPLTPVVLGKVTIVPEGQAIPPPAPPPPPPPAEPGAAPSPKRVNISAGMAAGMIVSKVTPLYPVDAKKAGVSGTVVLGAIIGTDGTVKEHHVVSGPEPLRQAALDAVRQWRYRPYLLNDEPVEVRTTINIIFTLAR